jgi:L-arabonate dehydrase
VKDGDVIKLDVPNRTLMIEVSEDEFKKRKAAWKPTHKQYDRGYVHLYQTNVDQAHLGADLKLLKGNSGSKVTRDSH